MRKSKNGCSQYRGLTNPEKEIDRKFIALLRAGQSHQRTIRAAILSVEGLYEKIFTIKDSRENKKGLLIFFPSKRGDDLR